MPNLIVLTVLPVFWSVARTTLSGNIWMRRLIEYPFLVVGTRSLREERPVEETSSSLPSCTKSG